MSEKKKKHLRLAAFSYSGLSSQAWRHPKIDAHQSLNVDYYIEIAQIAEKAKFDILFMPDGVFFDFVDVIQTYWSVSHFEPSTLFSAVAARTKNIGLLYTASVSDYLPALLARQVASLDHISHGRAGINIVTTQGLSSQDLGISKSEANDTEARYRRAQAFYDAMSILWDTFEDDALVRNKKSGVYVDLQKLHPPKIKGLYNIDIPMRIERPIQGRPVIAQAGTSPEGIAFGGSISDIIFCSAFSIEHARKTYDAIKKQAVAAGRAPEDIIVLTGVSVIWGATYEEAEDKLKELASLWPIEVAIENLGIDFSGYDLDDPCPEEYSLGSLKTQGRAAALAAFARDNQLTIRQLAERTCAGGGHRLVIGTTAYIADEMESWLDAGVTDGFMVIQPLLIQGHREFAENVIPELVRRGIFRSEYEGKTLRENLGLARPENIYTTQRRLGSLK